VLEFNFNWKLLSAIAGMTFWNFYFQLFPKTIRSAQVIEFLGHLKRHLRGPLLVVWDRLPAHRSRAVQEWVREQGGWIHTEHLPAYAPELSVRETGGSWMNGRGVPSSASAAAPGSSLPSGSNRSSRSSCAILCDSQ